MKKLMKKKTFDFLAQLEKDNEFNTIDVYIFSNNENENHIYNAFKHITSKLMPWPY